MIVVTQRYHLYRALYGCERMGIDSLGAAADRLSPEVRITGNSGKSWPETRYSPNG